MGLSYYTAKYIAREVDLRGKTVLTIGRQRLSFSARDRDEFASGLLWECEWCEPFFQCRGARIVNSVDIDLSDGATHRADLNVLITAPVLTYDFIFDGGTLEHLINPLVGLQNYMHMLNDGGLLVISTVANNYCGHGFYQFSPEFFLKTLPGCSIRMVEDGVRLPTFLGFHLPIPTFIKGRMVVEPNYGKRPVAMIVTSRKCEVRTNVSQRIYS